MLLSYRYFFLLFLFFLSFLLSILFHYYYFYVFFHILKNLFYSIYMWWIFVFFFAFSYMYTNKTSTVWCTEKELFLFTFFSSLFLLLFCCSIIEHYYIVEEWRGKKSREREERTNNNKNIKNSTENKILVSNIWWSIFSQLHKILIFLLVLLAMLYVECIKNETIASIMTARYHIE